MRSQQFSARTLETLLRSQRVATLEEPMGALGTPAERTVLRKLEELGYRTGYSHGGGYYTLEDIPVFNSQGLWSLRSVRFSAHGTLPSTAEAWVHAAEAGYVRR
jgi:hypothetical protein